MSIVNTLFATFYHFAAFALHLPCVILFSMCFFRSVLVNVSVFINFILPSSIIYILAHEIRRKANALHCC